VIGNLYRENIYDPNTPDIKVPRRVIKGAPHLCAPNYCRRHRPAARMVQAVDTQRVIGISLRNLGRQHKKQRLTLFEHTKKGGMK